MYGRLLFDAPEKSRLNFFLGAVVLDWELELLLFGFKFELDEFELLSVLLVGFDCDEVDELFSVLSVLLGLSRAIAFNESASGSDL